MTRTPTLILVKRIMAGLASPSLFIGVLAGLMLVLTLGTVAQARMGLLAAQRTYFESWVWWAGQVFPLPGMRSLLALLLAGLICRLALEQLTWKKAGIWLVHAGAVMLIAGGALSDWGHRQGYVVLADGETSQTLLAEPEDEQTPPNRWAREGDLPFKLTLQNFTQEFYPATELAKGYQSDMMVTAAGHAPVPAVITMNQPLRYQGWAVYQASYWQDEQGTMHSVLAVVQNRGRIVPYLSGLVMALGMLVILVQRWQLWRVAALAVLIGLPMAGHAAELDEQRLAAIPILQNGRVKPLDSFARDVALRLNGTDHPGGQAALRWLLDVVFIPENMAQVPSLEIGDSNTAQLLGLEWRTPHVYSLQELLPALQRQQKLILTLEAASDKNPKAPPSEMLAVYRRVQEMVTLGRSFSLMLPLFAVEDHEVARTLGVMPRVPFDYLTMIGMKAKYLPLIEGLEKGKIQGGREADILRLGMMLRLVGEDQGSTLFRILPPMWRTAAGQWVSPWAAYAEGLTSPEHVRYLRAWKDAMMAWRSKDNIRWVQATTEIEKTAHGWPQSLAPTRTLVLEVTLNRLKPFSWAMLGGLAAAILLGMGTVFKGTRGRIARLSGIGLAALTGVFLVGGMAARVMILGRPPVATLYESMLFVSAVTLAMGALVAGWKRETAPLGLASLTVSGLMAVAHWQAGAGDTLGMLVAVLNTHFWLTTHVLMITAGYGVCLLLSGWAHLLLARQAYTRREMIRTQEKPLMMVTVLALLLTATGTVLGGVWADQSWGRFWGWDPKENGALLIVLWLVLVLHVRFLRGANFTYFLAGCALTSCIVALSWFGVNLLNVGLHSYGFTHGLAGGLALFLVIDMGIIAGLGWANHAFLTHAARRS